MPYGWYITTGNEVGLDTTYWNATMETYPGEAMPYPFWSVRRVWAVLRSKVTGKVIFLWLTNYTSRSVFVYLRQTIDNGQNTFGNYWAYTHLATATSDHIVSHGKIPGRKFRIPSCTFLTSSHYYSTKEPAKSMSSMFYGFLLPLHHRQTEPSPLRQTEPSPLLPSICRDGSTIPHRGSSTDARFNHNNIFVSFYLYFEQE